FEPLLGRGDRRLNIAVDLRGSGEGTDKPSGAATLAGDRYDFGHFTIAVENDDRLPAGRPADQLARTVAKLPHFDPCHRAQIIAKICSQIKPRSCALAYRARRRDRRPPLNRV